MTRPKHTLLALGTALVLAAPMAAPFATTVNAETESAGTTLSDSSAYVQGEAIVLYQGTSARSASTFSKQLQSKVEVVGSYTFDTRNDANLAIQAQGAAVPEQGFVVSLVRAEDLTTAQLVESLSSQPDVLAAEPNYQIQLQSYDNDPYASYQWALENTGQNGGTVGADLHADDPNITLSPDAGEQVIAIVDTGIDYTHPDLADKMWVNPYQETGALAGTHGYDFYYDDDDPMDGNGHGTHCAGIAAAATGDGVGIAGTAGDNVRLMALQIFSEYGTSDTYHEIGAYHYIYQAQRLGVNVVAINNSWGVQPITNSDETPLTEHPVMEMLVNLVGENGALTLAAAGNETTNTDHAYCYPSVIDSPYLISVAATDEQDRLTNFSNYGTNVDIAAPGLNILSSVSYPSFQPLLMSEEERSEKLAYYEDFSDVTPVMTATGTTVLLSDDEATIGYSLDSSDEAAEMTVTRDTTLYHENPSDTAASLHWSIPNAVAGNDYTLYLPVAAQNLDSAMYKAEIMTYSDMPFPLVDLSEESIPSSIDVTLYPTENGEIVPFDGQYLGGYYIDQGYSSWDPYESNDTSNLYGDMVVMEIQITCEIDASYEIYLDNVALSDPSIPADELTVPYDFYSGTSMATPYVTGAATLVAGMYPEMSATERASLLLGCVRHSEALEGLVASNGVLDLSYLSDPKPVVTETWVDTDMGVLYIYGGRLDQTTITINNTPATYLYQDETHVEISISDYEKHHVYILVDAGNSWYKEIFYYATGMAPDATYISQDDISVQKGDQILTIDDKLYYCAAYGYVYLYDPALEGWTMWNENLITDGGFIDLLDYEVSIWGYGVVGTDIYAVLRQDYGYSVELSLMIYDTTENFWYPSCEVPADMMALDQMMVTAFQGQVYFLGGVTSSAEAYSSRVVSYDPESGTWTTHPDLPAAAYGGRALVVGDTLAITLAQTEMGTSTDLWQYDGTDWTVTEQVLPDISWLVQAEDTTVNTAVCAYGDSLIYTGLPTDSLGDILVYDTVSQTLTGSDYSVYNLTDYLLFHTAVLDDVLYISYQNEEMGTNLSLISLNGEPLPDTPTNSDPPEDPGTSVDPDTPQDPDDLFTLLGDINMDDAVGIDDAYAVLSYYANEAAGVTDNFLTDGTDPDLELVAIMAADVDGDGEITIQDAYYILLYYANNAAGIETSWDDILPQEMGAVG